MGSDKRVQPMRGKIGVGPALMIRSTSATTPVLAFAENTAQPHSHPAVLSFQRVFLAMFEIIKPASQRLVHVLDDDRQGLSVSSPRLLADGVAHFLDTLRSGPFIAALEVIAKKVESTPYRRVHNTSLFRMQAQSVAVCPVLHPRKRLARFRFRMAQHHEVIGITNHLYPSAPQQVVQRVEIDIGQQRRDNRSLRRSFRWCPVGQAFHYALLQIVPKQFDYSPIRDRSEEHTSELQSPCNLVCRLLLEKKKKANNIVCPQIPRYYIRLTRARL